MISTVKVRLIWFFIFLVLAAMSFFSDAEVILGHLKRECHKNGVYF